MSITSSSNGGVNPVLPVKDLYKMTAGAKSEWGVEGYYAPKPCLYTTHQFKFPNEKRKDFISEAKKRENEPDPSKYALEPKKFNEMYWRKPNGKFLQGKRTTYTDDAIKRSKTTPAPSDYFKTDKKSQKPIVSIGGKISKTEGISFMTTTEYNSEQLPEPSKYKPNFKQVERRTPNWGMGKPIPAKKKSKDNIGPGSYADAYFKHEKKVVKSSPSFSVPKSRQPNSVVQATTVTKNNPGVGAYKELDRAFTSNTVWKRQRAAAITPYKFRRSTDEYTKSKDWVPGPGSYNVGPPAIQKSK